MNEQIEGKETRSAAGRPQNTMRIVPVGGLLLFLVMILAGCVTAPVVKTVEFREKGQTSGESQGAQAAKARMARALAPGIQNRKERVLWGGVSVWGNDESGNNAPYCTKLASELQAVLVEALRTCDPPSFELAGIGDGLADNWRQQDALVMVVVLSSEKVFSLPTSGQNRVNVDVMGYILFIDTKNGMQATSSYPLSVNVVDLLDHPPTEDETIAMFKTALLALDKNKSSRAYGLAGQVIETLAEGAMAPRAVRSPIAVDPVAFGPAIHAGLFLGKPFDVDVGRVAPWRDILANHLCLHLGFRSGFPVNPYTGNGSMVRTEQSLASAAQLTMRRTDGQQLSVAIPKPVLLIHLQVDALIAEESRVQPKEFALTKVAYGFHGKLRVLNADSGREIISVVIEVPGTRQTVSNSKLLKRYDDMVTVPLQTSTIEGGKVDHLGMWRSQLSRFVEQLAHEIAFPEEDVLKRFGVIRNSIQRNAGGGKAQDGGTLAMAR